jgi:hypothetical protein
VVKVVKKMLSLGGPTLKKLKKIRKNKEKMWCNESCTLPINIKGYGSNINPLSYAP